MVDEEFISRFKQRFKGVETFLRRVAFNLGNSPSQTEVKIISCIPIDITDLQNKIISLEKQLEDARKRPKSATVAAAHLKCRHCPAEPSTNGNVTSYCEMNKPYQATELNKDSDLCRLKGSRLSCTYPDVSKMNKNTLATVHNKNAQVYCNFDENNKNIFKKVKKKKDLEKSDNFKTHLVYYAQTNNSPFNNYNANMKSGIRDISNRNNQRHNSRSYTKEMIWGKHEARPRSILDDFPDESNFPGQARGIHRYKKNESDDTHSYLEHMIRKQYEPRSILDEFSDSTFSSPICRDNEQNHNASPFDFDSCSCCHGTFHNTDNLDHIRDNLLPAHTVNENLSERSIFYDSNHYDMVPVKEIPTKIKKNSANCERKHKSGINIMYPHTGEAKSKNNTQIINYHTLSTRKHQSPKISPIKVTNKKEIVPITIVPRRHAATATSVRPIEVDTSKSCYIDFGNVYMKRAREKHNRPKMIQTKTSLLLKNAECLATNIVNIDCQTTATQSIEMDDHKTEQTLNQIKCILQSVLSEVKTSTQKRNSPHKKNTKDAIVQKGTSRGYVPGYSDLLKNYTYSTCNLSPCSRHLNSSPYCSNLPYNAMKCMHNFPAFIQTPNRNMCSGCYRNSHLAKVSYPRPAITAATNTDNNKEHSEETEKLIKEIYKSIAPNFDMPTKDISTSENNDPRSDCISISRSTHADKKLSHNTGITIKSLPKTTSNTPNSILTPLSMNTFTTNLQSNTASNRSQIASTTDTDRHLRNDQIGKFVQNKSRTSMKSVREEYELPSEDAVVSEYTELSDEETEQDIGDQQPTKHKEKENIFTKMFKSVKLFKSKNKQEQPDHISEYEEEDENDSDYETIYSQKIDRKRYLSSQNRIRKLPHSKISYSRQIPEKRVPNMNQEDRRQWAEQLVFHNDQPKYFSEQPRYSRDTNKTKERQAYWQNYQTRNAMIDQNESATHSKDYTSGTSYL